MTLLATHRFSPTALASLAPDAHQLAAVLAVVDQQVRDLRQRLDQLRRLEVPAGAARLQRDLDIHQLTSRLHVLSRLGNELCLGRFDRTDGSRVYVGRLGLRDADGRQLLVDWRTPEAEPFFAATLASPMGVVRRRRFRWAEGLVVDSWDEWLDLDAPQEETGLQDAQSAFLASLAASRTDRMSSALATIQADQDAIVRADARGCTVVDGGPGTGKTVVALHRAAYLSFVHQDAVLYVTKHARLAAYVQDVLPSAGEDDVPVVALEDLYVERATRHDSQPSLGRLKGDPRMVTAIDRAVAFFQDLPQEPVVAELPDGDVVVRPRHWVDALQTCGENQHIPRRRELLEALADLLDVPAVARDAAVVRALRATWPDLTPAGVVTDLLTHQRLLAHCAPWLTQTERATVRGHALEGGGWHVTDLPLLDVARQRLGLDPVEEVPAVELATRRAAAREAVARMRELADADNAHLYMLSDGEDGLVDTADVLEPSSAPLPLSLGERTFAHVVVDEAQDLTGVEWQVLLWRCPSRSFTVVGDRAQSRAPFDESWADRMTAVGLPRARVLRLSMSYRTPAPLLAPAAAVILAARPDVQVPEAVRTDGRPLELTRLDDDADLVSTALQWAIARLNGSGTAAVVLHPDRARPAAPDAVGWYAPDELQGLEMDVVVVVEPVELWNDDQAASAPSLYVTLTRATQAVLVLHRRPLPVFAHPLGQPSSRVGSTP